MRPNFDRIRMVPGVAIALALGGCAAKNSPPLLYIATPTVKLGVLEPGTHAISVAIENGGGNTLRIGKVSSSCACTVGEAPGELPSGAKGMVRASVTVIPGPGAARLSVASNTPDRDEQVIHISWFGKSRPRLVPAAIDVSSKVGEVAVQEVEICYAGGDPEDRLKYAGASNLPEGITIRKVSDNPSAIRTIPGLGVSVDEAPALTVGKSVLQVECRATGAVALERTATIIVEQRGTTYELLLSISIKPHQALRSSPSSLMFGASTLEKLRSIERKAVLIAESMGGGNIEIVRQPDYLDVRLAGLPDSQGRTELVASVKGVPPLESLRDEIVLKHAAGSELKIPVYVDHGR